MLSSQTNFMKFRSDGCRPSKIPEIQIRQCWFGFLFYFFDFLIKLFWPIASLKIWSATGKSNIEIAICPSYPWQNSWSPGSILTLANSQILIQTAPVSTQAQFMKFRSNHFDQSPAKILTFRSDRLCRNTFARIATNLSQTKTLKFRSNMTKFMKLRSAGIHPILIQPFDPPLSKMQNKSYHLSRLPGCLPSSAAMRWVSTFASLSVVARPLADDVSRRNAYLSSSFRLAGRQKPTYLKLAILLSKNASDSQQSFDQAAEDYNASPGVAGTSLEISRGSVFARLLRAELGIIISFLHEMSSRIESCVLEHLSTAACNVGGSEHSHESGCRHEDDHAGPFGWGSREPGRMGRAPFATAEAWVDLLLPEEAFRDPLFVLWVTATQPDGWLSRWLLQGRETGSHIDEFTEALTMWGAQFTMLHCHFRPWVEGLRIAWVTLQPALHPQIP